MLKTIIIRPRHCRWCTHIYYGMKHVVEEAEKTKTPYIDLENGKATKEQIIDTIKNNPDYNFISMTGHGSPSLYTAENEEIVFNIENCGILSNKTTWAHSCLTGKQLGPAVIKKNGNAYTGFIIEWMWAYTEDEKGDFKYPDPYDDPIAKMFFTSANMVPNTVLHGRTINEAYQASIEEYNHWIDTLFKSDIENAGQLIGLLAVDRDGMILLSKTKPSLEKPVIVKPIIITGIILSGLTIPLLIK